VRPRWPAGNWGAITCGSQQAGGIRNVYASFGPFHISDCSSTKIAGKTFDVSGLSALPCTASPWRTPRLTLKYVDNAQFTNAAVTGVPI